MPPEVSELADALDHLAVEMLRAIEEHDGTATTTEIREATNLDNGQVQYRRRKLRDLGLIEVRDGRAAGNRTPPKRHSLTDDAKAAIARGLYDQVPAPKPGTFDELARQVVDLNDRVRALEERVEENEDRARKAHRVLSRHLEDMKHRDSTPLHERLAALEDRLDDHDERLQNKRDERRIFR